MNSITSFLFTGMKRSHFSFVLLPLIFSLITTTLRAQFPPVVWQRGYNAFHNWHGAEDIKPVTGGGYIMTGFANTVTGWGSDVWVARLDSAGEVLWEHSFGGSDVEVAKTVLQTNDGGFIILAETNSVDADVQDNHGGSDIWLIRLDAAGALLWKRCYGGSTVEHDGNIVQHADGSFTIVATTLSNDGDLAGVPLPPTNIINWPFSYNTWLLHLDAQGNILWQRCYGGESDEQANDIKLLPDGGFLVTGSTSSNTHDVAGNHINGTAFLPDVWVFRTDAAGNILWQRCLGGSYLDFGEAGIPTSDGGYAIVGTTYSSDGDVTSQQPGGWCDLWVVKLDAAGQLLWQQSIGGTFVEKGMNILEYEGKLVVAGVTASDDGMMQGIRVGGATDLWLGALSLSGTLLWQQCYGGANRDGETVWHIDVNTIGLARASDGGLVIAAQSTSGDIPHITDEVWSAYVIKLKPEHCDTVFHTDNTLVCRDVVWPLTLSAPAGSGPYTWSTGAATASAGVTDTGIYWCVYGEACNMRADTFIVGYKPVLPAPPPGDSLQLCQGNIHAIGTARDGVSYRWNTGSVACCIVPEAPGWYIREQSDGCTTITDSVYVSIRSCDDCLFMPNAFSPDGDGLNDRFGGIAYCRMEHYQLSIYNRWGERVFFATQPEQRWDGTLKGQPMPVGTYFYQVSYFISGRHETNRKGDLQLIR